MSTEKRITIASGDGIGPEIMDAVLSILQAAKCPFAMDEIAIGEQVYLSGNTSGIPEDAFGTLRQNKVLLKAPITTPQGGGYKSLNVTLRKALGLFANVRPCKAMHPYVPTNHPDMDLVIIRENEEGLYAGIEHRHTYDAYQTLKIFTRAGCERIIRFAFEYAKQFNRRKLTCMSKDNIMKMTDGLFHKTFDNIAKEYPGFELEHQIIDIGAAQIAARPERFDVIVTSNLYGDIISDIAALVAGSVGLAGSANIGQDFAMFEAIHGSAPDIAGKNIANPSGLLNAAVQMLVHMGAADVAANIQNAWLKTIEDGLHTGDIYSEHFSKAKLSTSQFAEEVVARLGDAPANFAKVTYQTNSGIKVADIKRPEPLPTKALVGVDVFLDAENQDAKTMLARITAVDCPLKLIVVTNRGLKVWPGALPDASFCDEWCCRYQLDDNNDSFAPVTHEQVLKQVQALQAAGLPFVKLENLYTFNERRAFSLAQGQ